MKSQTVVATRKGKNRDWLNISALTKGFILPYFRYVIRRRGGGGGYGEFNETH